MDVAPVAVREGEPRRQDSAVTGRPGLTTVVKQCCINGPLEQPLVACLCYLPGLLWSSGVCGHDCRMVYPSRILVG